MATTVTRRTFLRQTATASAVAATGVTIAAAAGAAHPDAELMELGVRFDRLLPLVRPAWKRARLAIDAFDAAYPGKKYDPRGNLAEGYDDAFRASEASRIEDEADAISNEIMSVTTAIRVRPAATLAGLFVKARALKYDLCLHCDDPSPREEWDFDEECLAVFIDEVERMALAGRA